MTISDLALISAAVSSVIIFLLLALRKPFTGATRWPFYQKRVLTRAELTLYFRIVHAMPDHLVFPKVPLESVLGVKNGYRASSWTQRISGLSTDFLVCTRDATIVVAIDMDGKTPETPKRIAENEKKREALESAGIKLVRWHVRSMPTDAAIRDMLMRHVRHVDPFHGDEPRNAPGASAPDPEKASYMPLSRRPAPVSN